MDLLPILKQRTAQKTEKALDLAERAYVTQTGKVMMEEPRDAGFPTASRSG